MDKNYRIKFDEQKKFWEEGLISALVMDEARSRTLELAAEIEVEDSPESPYPALQNALLQVVRHEIVALDEGQAAEIYLRVNPNSEQRQQLIRYQRRFRVRVRLHPKFQQQDGTVKTLSAVGETQITVERPVQLVLTLRKTNCLQAEARNLFDDDAVRAQSDDLKDLFETGGTLLLRPRAALKPDNSRAAFLQSQKSIAYAEKCQLDIGLGEIIEGEWQPAQNGYTFAIPVWDSEAAAQPGAVTLDCSIEIHADFATRLRKILEYAGELAKALGHDEINRRASTYVEAFLTHVAKYSLAELESREKALQTWLNNVANFMTSVSIVPGMFNESLRLFDEAFGRFKKNFVDFVLELAFMAAGRYVDKKYGTPAEVPDQLKTVLKEEARLGINETGREIAEIGLKLSAWDTLVKTTGGVFETLEKMLQAGFKTVKDGDIVKSLDDFNTALSQFLKHRDAYVDQVSKKAVYEALETIPETVTGDALENAIRTAVKNIPKSKAADEALESIIKIIQGNDVALSRLVNNLTAEKVGASAVRAAQIDQTIKLIRQVRASASKRALYDMAQGEAIITQVYKKSLSDQMSALKDLQPEANQQQRTRSKTWAQIWDDVINAITYIPRKMMGLMISGFMWRDTWAETGLKPSVYGEGVVGLKLLDLPDTFFDFPGPYLKEMLQKDYSVSEDQRQKEQEKAALSARSDEGYQREKAVQRRQGVAVLRKIIAEALDPARLEKEPPPPYQAKSKEAVWFPLHEKMKEYDLAFAATGQTLLDNIPSVRRFMGMQTWQDIDGLIEEIGWAVSWLLKLIGALGLYFLGLGVVLIKASEWVDVIVSAARGLVSYFATMPTATGFQADTLISAYWLYEIAITGNQTETEIFDLRN